MRAVVHTPAVALATFALLAACGGDNPVCCRPDGTGQFTASVTGASSKSLSGSAGFLVSPSLFTIALQNGANDGAYIQLSRAAGAPAAGTYAVKGDGAQSTDFVAVYAGGGTDNYAATGGSVAITAAAADRVTGTFSFAGTGGTSGSATVNVSGSFDAKRLTAP